MRLFCLFIVSATVTFVVACNTGDDSAVTLVGGGTTGSGGATMDASPGVPPTCSALMHLEQAPDCPVLPHAVVAHCYDGGPCEFTSCASGYANCDEQPANGCEVSVLSDPDNCGTCGGTCPSGSLCSGGVCQ